MIQIFDCEQGSEDWFRLRLGVPTASNFSTIMAHGRGGGESKGRDTLMRKLAGEILTGEPAERYSNSSMERGKEMEAEARNLYAFTNEVELTRVGFVRNGIMGCSPDSLIGTDGALEVNTQAPHLLIETLTKGSFPPEHRAQCQGTLLVTERQWIDLIVYYRGMPPLIIRQERDEGYIEQIKESVTVFEYDLRQLVKRIKEIGA